MTSWFPMSPFLQYILNNKFVSLLLSTYYRSKGRQEGTARTHLLHPMVPLSLWSWTSSWISFSLSVLPKGSNEVRVQKTSTPWKSIRCSTNTVKTCPGNIWGHVCSQCVLDQSPTDHGGPSLFALIHASQRLQCQWAAATMSHATGMHMLYSYL